MRLIALFCLLLSAVPALAQDSAEKRTCRIVFLNPPPNPPEKWFLHDGAASREVELPQMNFSEVYPLASGEITLTLLTKPLPEGGAIPAGAPSAKVPAEMTDLYLLATGDPANTAAPVRIQVIDAGQGKFRKGQMMWFNLGPNPMGGTVGSQKLAMKPRSRTVIDAPSAEGGSYPVSLSYQIPGDPKFHSICQTKWTHDPRSRMVMFVYGGENNRVPQVSGFKDFRAPAEKPQ